MSRYVLPDEAATQALAQVLATTQPASAVVHLQGDLGAGKSTLARGWLRALGVTGPVRSPTYTLVERYPLTGGAEALHLDLYRIGDAGELEFLGLDDVAASLWLIEWPERGARALPPADLRIELVQSGTGRAATLVPTSESGRAWLAEVDASSRLSTIPEPSP
ncbi:MULTISPECIES: tRNA (adenosine(37)-N6)-threonylcarbamoyltransferase complex ATPase subunit type 1 TsaE [Luteimonas]|jgi:tRNA threonylcarbamoyladenosine biosynthesis protein TsaE|uniref:tRNA (adenosine(37)-N6)-threonylcarbamoyltransferase complex ATPase subunit type 1 TsaE n=1 Tax=Luteimonas TaxID=83614 RepID=UPI000C7BE481|nr:MULTISPECIES: tRNA (adenosine(37)-N6)-threonylcarbamoyltransferase complex ATPase subunit type 1 TsaE [Luteimonas]